MPRTRTTSLSPKRGPYKKPRLSETQGVIKAAILEAASKKMTEENKRTGTQCSKGFMDDLLKDTQSSSVLKDATRDALYNAKKKHVKQQSTKPPPPPQVTPTIRPPSNDEPTEVTPSPVVNNKGGRPKGSSDEGRGRRKQAYELAMDAASVKHANELAKANGKLRRGRLQEITQEAQTNCRVHPSMQLNPETIRARGKRGHLTDKRKTPMEKIEPYLVAVTIEKHRQGHPFNEKTFLQFANSLIHDTDTKKEVIRRKEVAHLDVESSDALGKKHYQNFLKRHKLVLESAKAHSRDVNRAHWSAHGNFKHMHDYTHNQLELLGIAEKLVS